MDSCITDDRSAVVAFSIGGNISRAIEEAAARDLITRSAWARKIIVAHLIETGAITGKEALVGRSGPRPRQVGVAA